jgi:hypothetical protein
MRVLSWMATVFFAVAISWSFYSRSQCVIASESETSVLYGAAVKCKNPLRQKEGCGEPVDGTGVACDVVGTVWALNSDGNQKEASRYCKTKKETGALGTCGVYDILGNCTGNELPSE